jgi:uncharacterized protein (TIGR02231 family)
MVRWILISLVLVLGCAQGVLAESGILEVAGTVSDVIVYRGQAMVSRAIEVDLPQGDCEIVVKKLPREVIAESIFAIGDADVTVASVRYRQKETGKDTRQEVKDLETKIEEVVKQQYQAQRDHDISDWLFKQFSGQWGLSINAANTDLNRGLLQSEPIQALTSYLESKATKCHENSVKTELRQKELEKELGELQRKLNDLKAGTSRVEREAVINVTSAGKQKAVIRLNYLVNGANWLPQYNLRANPDKGIVSVEYNALIHQTSGEDWNNVTVSLSTAQPAMMAAPPVLEPMKVGLTAGGGVSGSLDKEKPVGAAPSSQSAYRDLSSEFQMVQSQRREMATKGKAAQSQLNVAAMSSQMMELRADKDTLQLIQSEAKRVARTEGVGVSYSLPGKLTMPTRTEQQLVGIAAFEGKADFVMVGAPLLTDYVYLQADVTNDSAVVMLAGPASMYRDGEFVGRGEMELVTMGEKFTVGLGVDSQIRIAREFKDKKIDTLWGRKRTEKYDYRIAISNYKDRKVKLRLLERIPYTEDESLEMKDFETKPALSTDAEYLRTERNKGILRWDLELPPNTNEEGATVVTYSYTMRYDSGMQIQSVGPVGVRRME